MSHRYTFAITPDARAKLLAMFPGITAADLIRFDDLVAADRLLTDDGKPTQALVDWVKALAR